MLFKLHSEVDIILSHKLTNLFQKSVQQNKQAPLMDVCIHVATLCGVSGYEDCLCFSQLVSWEID